MSTNFKDLLAIPRAVQPSLKLYPNVKNIIAVASGKGGVGKSTVAVNLALALVADGANVGLLDADIYGPSQAVMLDVNEKPQTKDNKTIEPIEKYGLQAMSMGFLVSAKMPMVWRGPMLGKALEQLAQDTQWRDLDCLVIDLPPGTGDVQLTLSQKIPVSGAVIVTTPQDIALADARKAIEMFRKVNVGVLGVIENMSHHVCSNCGHEEFVFGQGGGEKLTKEYDVAYLGGIPLDARIQQETDAGKPCVARDPESSVSRYYRDIAHRMVEVLSQRKKDYSGRIPGIKVEE